MDVRRPLLSPGWKFRTRVSFRVCPRGGAGGGVGETLEGQRTLPGAEVCVGQGGVQREEVGRRGQDLGPLGIGENRCVSFIWRTQKKERKTENQIQLALQVLFNSTSNDSFSALSIEFDLMSLPLFSGHLR